MIEEFESNKICNLGTIKCDSSTMEEATELFRSIAWAMTPIEIVTTPEEYETLHFRLEEARDIANGIAERWEHDQSDIINLINENIKTLEKIGSRGSKRLKCD